MLLWASPYWAVSGFVQAAHLGDAELVSDYVDFERLKQSFKSQLVASMQAEMAKDSTSGWEAIGLAFGSALVDPMVDAALTPEALVQALSANVRDLEASRLSMTVRLIDNSDAGWVTDSSFRVRMGKDTAMTWRRDGLTWRLTSIRIPLDGKEFLKD